MMMAAADGHAPPQFFVGAGSNETGGLKWIGPTMEQGGHQDRVIGESGMTNAVKPQIYRDLIDHLVDVCHDGQGQIGVRRLRAGVWNRNATAEFLPDQHEVNLLLARMPDADREILARLMSKEFERGVFETLKALEEFEIAPFETGYEGSPFNDFVGRLDDWQWPEP